jgi:pilus assembly protein CpaB
VRNVRVLATDQPIASNSEDGNTHVNTFHNVPVEVTPPIAEKVAVSQSMGTLTLSLRSIADNTAELERAVAAGEVRLPPGTNPAEERKLLLSVANRPNDSNTTFTTGGDVSRFQRRTVPAKPPSRDPASAMASFARALGGPGGGTDGAPAGPVVRVTRGNTSTVVPVGAR